LLIYQILSLAGIIKIFVRIDGEKAYLPLIAGISPVN